MAFAGRTLNIFGRSATRVRSNAVQRLRAEFAEGPGNFARSGHNILITSQAGTGKSQNMPFQTKNKPRLLATMILYLGTMFTLPFIAVRFQMHKQSGK